MTAIKFIVLALTVAAAGVWFFMPAPSAADISGDGCLVLAYHRFIAGPWPVVDWFGAMDEFTLFDGEFRDQIRSLKASGVHFITPQDLQNIVRRHGATPSKCVMVTLDDGDVSQYRFAYRTLKDEHVPFALFLITGQIGAKRFNGLEMLQWQQIREMLDSGLVTLGSHTHNMHTVDAADKPPFLKPENLKWFSEDLTTSVQTIQQQTGVRPQYFAYPYGFGMPQTDEAAIRLGMQLLFTLKPGTVRSGDPAFYVKRILVNEQSWPAVARWVER